MNRYTQSKQVQQIFFMLKFCGWYELITVGEVARRMNENGMRTVRGKQWTEANLRAFSRRHTFARNALDNLRHDVGRSESMAVTVDDPALFEMARPELADVLTVTEGLRHPRLISRIIEKGDSANRERLRQAIEDDPEVREEVLRFAPLMLEFEHPWATADYKEFLEYARAADAG